MNRHELFQWAKNHTFPQLVISVNPREVIRAGEVAWWLFTLMANDEQLGRAEARTRQWTEYEREVAAS